MAKTYVPCDRDAPFLLPPSLTDWLSEGHLAYFVIDAVSKINTAALHKKHPNWGPGRAAYDPDMLLSLLIYAYCPGTCSSREIERSCEDDIAYRVITVNQVPDHGTIARFRAGCDEVIEDLFIQVLTLCAEAGMAKLGVVALDGTKIAASASMKATRSQAQIQREVDALKAQIHKEVAAMLGRAASEDAAQDRLFGTERGDELPEHLAGRTGRLAHLEEALRRLEQRREEAQATEREALAEKTAKRLEVARRVTRLDPRRKPRHEPTVAEAESDLKVANEQAAAAKALRDQREAAAQAKGRKMTGFAPDLQRGIAQAEEELARAQAAEAEAFAKERINTTDADSQIMKTRQGFLQGFNAQTVVSEDQIILAADVSTCGADVGSYVPMIDATVANLRAAGIGDAIGSVLADAGYVSTANFAAPGPDRLIATSKAYKLQRQATEEGVSTGPPPVDATLLEAMTYRLLTQEGAAAYAKRQYTVEPVFGQIKENRGYRRFMRRGLGAATAEWRLLALTHNLLKLHARAKGTSTGSRNVVRSLRGALSARGPGRSTRAVGPNLLSTAA